MLNFEHRSEKTSLFEVGHSVYDIFIGSQLSIQLFLKYLFGRCLRPGLYAHTPGGLGRGPVSAPIPNAGNVGALHHAMTVKVEMVLRVKTYEVLKTL